VSAFIPLIDFENNDANYQAIVERMARAKWITGTAIATPREIGAFLTELGKQKVAQIRLVMQECFPDIVNADDLTKPLPYKTPVQALAALYMATLRLDPIFEDLQPPPIGTLEKQTLFGLFLGFSCKEGAIPPPPRPNRS
jgi:hypothetical protein